MPWPGGLVVKNGSKARALVSAFMPVPVSVTASSTYGPATTTNGSPSTDRVSSTLAVSIVSSPPSRIASRALTARFISTCSSCAASALTGHRSSDRIRPQLDVLANQPREQLLDVIDDLVDVEQRRLQHLLPAERQQLPGQRRGAVAGLLDLLGIAPQRVVVAQLPQQDLGVAADGLDQVVEVVGDAAGEAADRLHLLHALQTDLALEQPFLGDLAQDGRREDVAERLQERQVLRARQAVVDVEDRDHAERMADAVQPDARHRLDGVFTQHRRQPELRVRRQGVDDAGRLLEDVAAERALAGAERDAADDAGPPADRRRASATRRHQATARRTRRGRCG